MKVTKNKKIIKAFNLKWKILKLKLIKKKKSNKYQNPTKLWKKKKIKKK